MREGKILPRDVHMERRHEYLHRGFKLQLFHRWVLLAGSHCLSPGSTWIYERVRGGLPGVGASTGCRV